MREAKQLFDATRKAAEQGKNFQLVVAPPAIFLRELTAAYKGKRISFATQNAHAEAKGAFTGATSLAQAKDARASFAVIGHSEKRARGTNNDDTRRQVAAALALKLTPILCVGEQQRDSSAEFFPFVREQLIAGFSDVPATQIAKVIVAYEPVWVIGGEKTMNPRQMHEMAIFIRKTIVEQYGEKGHAIKILYGGSVNEESTRPMLEGGDVAGLLVGHVSIDAPRFAALLATIG